MRMSKIVFQSVFIVGFGSNVCSFVHQEVFSSCIFSLASITMADHQEYSFIQFLSIQMVSFCLILMYLYKCVFFGAHV